jgi:membrane fusion protein
MSGGSLFRREVMTGRGQSVYGQITLAQPASLKVLTIISILIAACLAVYLAKGTYTRKVQVSGLLTPTEGLIKITSPQGGLITAMYVVEGQTVHRGDVLFEVSSQRITEDKNTGSVEKLTAAQLLVKQISLGTEKNQQSQLLGEQLNGLNRRADSMQAELAQIDVELGTQQNRLLLSQQNLQRHENMVAQNFISSAQLLQFQTDQLEQLSRLQQLQRNRLSMLRELNNVRTELRQMPLRMQAQLGTIERSLAGLTQEQAENSARRSATVLAQHDGVVTGITVTRGTTVGAGVPLVSLVPQGTRLQAHLFAPSQAVGFIEPGQAVMLRYAAYPYQKFGHQNGTVAHVSKTSLSPAEAMGLPGFPAMLGNFQQNSEPLYRITVTLDNDSISVYGKKQQLLPGMALDAAVMQERRYLWEWVLEPLYSVTGKV